MGSWCNFDTTIFSSLERSSYMFFCRVLRVLNKRFSTWLKICPAFWTGIAPFRINLRHPKLCLSKILPGTENTSLFWSTAFSAVRIAPLLSPASITTVPWARPLIILFLFGKFPAFGFVPRENSEIIVPFSSIFSAKTLFSGGYKTSTPLHKTAIVLPLESTVFLWDIESMPRAKPLTMVIPYFIRSPARFWATFLP